MRLLLQASSILCLAVLAACSSDSGEGGPAGRSGTAETPDSSAANHENGGNASTAEFDTGAAGSTAEFDTGAAGSTGVAESEETRGDAGRAGALGRGGDSGTIETGPLGGAAHAGGTARGGAGGADPVPEAGSTTGGSTGAQLRCEQSKDSCSCMDTTIAPIEEAYECSSVSIAGYCCNDALGNCICRHYACEEDSLGCDCGSDNAGAKTKCSKTYPICCMYNRGGWSACMCDSLGIPCDTDWVQVSSCDVAKANCDTDETKTDSCKP